MEELRCKVEKINHIRSMERLAKKENNSSMYEMLKEQESSLMAGLISYCDKNNLKVPRI